MCCLQQYVGHVLTVYVEVDDVKKYTGKYLMPDFDDLPLPVSEDEAKPGSRDYAIMEWADYRLKQGSHFVESSPGYDRISRSLNEIFSEEQSSQASYVPTPKPLSKTRLNITGKIAEDLTAQLTDTRVFWDYSTNNPKYEKQASLSNKEAEMWYTSRLIALRLADVIRYYTIAGTGFAHLYYSKRLDDMMLEALDPRNVFPIDPISYHTLQDALGVIYRKASTPHWVKSEYGVDVKPDVGAPGVFGWFTRMVGSQRQKVSGPLSKRTGGGDDAIPFTPTVFVNTMYLSDDRVNESSQTRFMGKWKDGEPRNQWSYKVPPGAPMYPFKRMIVWCTGHILYDGPSPYWHAQFPIIKLTLNPWPKTWLGKAPLWDILPLNGSLNNLLRVIDDHAAQVAQPSVTADRNVSKAELNKFDSRTPGAKIRTNMASGKGITINTPPPLDQSLWQHVNWEIDKAQWLAGTFDPSAIASLAQMPSNDTLDTMYKFMTPAVRLRSRILEGFMVELSEQYLYCIAEFDTLSKRLARFGPNAVTNEDFDYAPGTFVPDDMPDGDPGDIASTEDGLGSGPRPIYERATQMLKSFDFKFKPGSLLNSAAMQDRMEDFMLSKMGYLSFFTLMENLGKTNITGPNVTVPDDELGRLALQQKLGIGMLANAQGRKATDQAPPQLTTDGSGDPTLQTS